MHKNRFLALIGFKLIKLIKLEIIKAIPTIEVQFKEELTMTIF